MSDSPRQLGESDLGDMVELSGKAGWNQTREDWARVMRLEPAGCFGIEQEGRVVATATAVCYQSALAWIGMVLTDPAYRGRGLARRLMMHTLDFLAQREIDWIQLDATDMGRPLYRSLGFADEAIVERWAGSGRRPSDRAPQFRPTAPDYAMDLEAFGADRRRLLEALIPAGGDLADRGAAGGVAVDGAGYAMARPGAVAAYFGPCVARSEDGARRLLEWFLARQAAEASYWDLLPENGAAVRLAHEHGFEPRRRLSRMALRGRRQAPPLERNDAMVFAIAGFEYG